MRVSSRRRSPRSTVRASSSTRRSPTCHAAERAGSAQQSLHAGEQLRHGERLREVVVAAGVEPGQAVVHRRSGGEEQDRDVAVAPQPAPDRQAAGSRRQPDVEDREIRAERPERLLESEPRRPPGGRGSRRRVQFTSGSFKVTVSAPPKGDQTITFAQPSSPQQYGGSFTVAPTASSGLPVTVSADGSCSISDNEVTMTTGSGNGTLTASQPGNDDYNAASNVVRTVAAVKRAASVTPNSASKVYGDADPALTGTLNGFLPADGVTAQYSRTAGEDAGSYIISATLSPSAVLGNYDVTEKNWTGCRQLQVKFVDGETYTANFKFVK